MLRPSQRQSNELRPIHFERHFTKHAAGAVLTSFGDTRVLCTASIEDGVPPFLKGKKQGWVTGEYGMLPGATNNRCAREAARGKQSARTVEIQRLIGRSLRAAVDLKALGERSIIVDCDVLQADGGTRTASISGAFVALFDAVTQLRTNEVIKNNPIHEFVASVSVGLYQNEVVLDLDYAEDSQADTDMNFVMTENNEFIEIQGTAEAKPFSLEQMTLMTQYASTGIEQIIALQKQSLGLDS